MASTTRACASTTSASTRATSSISATTSCASPTAPTDRRRAPNGRTDGPRSASFCNEQARSARKHLRARPRHLMRADEPVATPALLQEPRAWPPGRHRRVGLAQLPHERLDLAFLPAVEAPARCERIDQPAASPLVAMLVVLAPVVEHVRDRVPRLPRRLDDLDVVAVGKYRALAALPLGRNQ